MSTDITWPIEVLNSCKTIYGQIYHFSLIPIKRIQTPYFWLRTKFYSILEYQIFRQLYSKFSLISIWTIKKKKDFPWKKIFAGRIDQSYYWIVFVNKIVHFLWCKLKKFKIKMSDLQFFGSTIFRMVWSQNSMKLGKNNYIRGVRWRWRQFEGLMPVQ